MTDETKGVEETSPSPLAEAIASSPEALEETQETQTPPAQKGVTQETEEAKIPYSRLKEIVDEKNWYKQQLERSLQQQPQQQPQQPTQDPYAGMTPEEEKFWRTQRQIAREEAIKVSQEHIGQIKPIIDAGRMEIAQGHVREFRRDHPDIKPNSPEEIAIAEKIQMGYFTEDAYRSVMWDSKVADTERQKSQSDKQKIEAKKQANVEQRSIPQGATPPTKEKLTLRQRIEKAAEEMEL